MTIKDLKTYRKKRRDELNFRKRYDREYMEKISSEIFDLSYQMSDVEQKVFLGYYYNCETILALSMKLYFSERTIQRIKNKIIKDFIK